MVTGASPPTAATAVAAAATAAATAAAAAAATAPLSVVRSNRQMLTRKREAPQGRVAAGKAAWLRTQAKFLSRRVREDGSS